MDYKHYIKINENNAIVKLFSDAFEQPDEESILLRESDQRHAYLGDYNYNPQLMKDFTTYLYKKTGDLIIEEASEIPKTLEQKITEINEQVVTKIRQKYDINKEFQVQRLGLINNQNEEYLEYINHVNSCIVWGTNEKNNI